MLIDGFMLGFIATTSLVAALFFLRFYSRTRDFLFLSFAIAFAAEALNRTVAVFFPHPDASQSWMYILRLATYLLILFAILRKNARRSG